MTTESIKLFQALGVDIRDCDDRGLTCLHICLNRPALIGDLHEDFNTIKCLVESGANPYAISNNGTSVGQVAYRWRRRIGNYVGDLWDAVLQNCGFDVSQFRPKNHRRYAKYTNSYCRKHFEALWEGRESECPYWDDEPWPPLEPGEIDYDYEDGSRDGFEDESERMDCEDNAIYSQVETSSDELQEREDAMELGGRTLCYQCWKRCCSLENAEEDTNGDLESESDVQESPRTESHCEEQSNQGGIAYQQANAGGEMLHFPLLSDMELDNPWID